MQPTVGQGQTGPLGRVDPSLPQVFGRYLLVQRLSRGGMGEIFLAKHGLAGFEKLAVIKKVLPHLAADASFISRFVDEAQVAIKLQHVNVAQVFEVGRVGDEYFLALEYVEGRDLRRTLAVLQQRATRFPVDIALFIGRELANGLAYAHRRTTSDGSSLNLVHCDISPPNVLVSFEGETKVIDFGIAKSAMRGTATDPKMGFGKFGYMAPEQLIRGGIVDHRTDIYAAGVVLFELLTNKRLYEAGPEPDYRALAKKVAKGDYTLPSDVDKVLAPYDDLVATALRPKQEDRYQTAAEFRDAIQQALVGVNPTISTDRLGSYMRDLFAHEMTAQRELHDRVAKAHLEDFKDELTKETTVSFAMANLPLQAPADIPRPPRVPGRATSQARPRPPTLPTDILPQQPAQPPAIPTAAIPTTELALADGTGNVAPTDLSVPQAKQRNRKPLVVALVAGIVIGGGVLVLAMTHKSEPKPAQSAQQASPPKKAIVVESIPPEDQSPKPGSGSSTGSATLKVDSVEKVETPVKQVTTAKIDKKRHHPDIKKVTQPPPPTPKQDLTKDAVIAKFRQAKSAYDAYKQKNGGRYDQEWNDLAGYQQYHPNDLEGFAQRIENFRAKLRE